MPIACPQWVVRFISSTPTHFCSHYIRTCLCQFYCQLLCNLIIYYIIPLIISMGEGDVSMKTRFSALARLNIKVSCLKKKNYCQNTGEITGDQKRNIKVQKDSAFMLFQCLNFCSFLRSQNCKPRLWVEFSQERENRCSIGVLY